jgi:membrane protease YdiL (CAAX protease family)
MRGSDLLARLPESWRGEQAKAAVVLVLSPVLLAAWWYYGARNIWHPERAALVSFLSAFVLLGAIPALVVKFVFRERLADYGVQLGDRQRTLRWIAMLGAFFVASGYMAARDPSFSPQYPSDPAAGDSAGAFVLHALTYLMFYIGWEFHFRGFLQAGLRGAMGEVNAVLVASMASLLIHVGKPPMETFTSILGAMLWGFAAFRTRSILAGLVLHFLLGISLDAFMLFG